MSHSAGFRAGTWPWGGDKPWHPFEPTSWDQIVAMLPYTDVQFAPGSKYSYSNPGVIFLGRIVQLLSGDDYEVYVTKNILMPLGMRSSFFDRAPYYLLPHRSHSYLRDDNGLREARFDFDTGITVSNGGLNSPFDDMAKVPLLPDRGSEARRLRRRPQAIVARGDVDAAGTRRRGGRGERERLAGDAVVLRRAPCRSCELVGHSGDQNGFISHLSSSSSQPYGLAALDEHRYDAVEGRRAARSREVDAAVRELMLTHLIK